MSDEVFEVNSKEICPKMAQIINLLVQNGFDIDERQVVFAIAAVGFVLLDDQGFDIKDEVLRASLDMVSSTFIKGVQRFADQAQGAN